MTSKVIAWMRPFITVSFVGLTAYLTFAGKIEPKEVFLITSSLVSFWFGERSALKNNDDEK